MPRTGGTPGALPRTPGYLGQDEIKEMLTESSQNGGAVQGGIPMTAQGESTASPPCKRPEARCSSGADRNFILAINIPAGGFRRVRSAGGRA